MSLFKKAAVYLSVAALAAPVIASGSVGIASAATTAANNVKTTETAKPNSNLKVPLRDANNIFKMDLQKQKNGYVLVTDIAASGNNVIQKGEQLVINLDKTNVDLANSAVVNQDGVIPYTTKKDVNKGTVTITFTRNVDSGNYQTAVGIATKNLYTKSNVKATFEGAAINVANNGITSKWYPATSTNSNSSTTTSKQSYTTQNSSSQTSTTQSVATKATTQSSTSYTTTTGSTTSQAAQSQNGYTPTYDEAEKAVMGRTTINITGSLATPLNTETSANVATNATTDNTSTAATTTGDTSSGASGTAATAPKATQATNDSTASGSVATATNSDQATQTAAKDADVSQAATTTTGDTASTTNNPVASTATADGSTAVQAGANANNVVQTPNGVASDPEKTLQDVLKDQADNPQGDKTTYESNKTFETTKNDIIAKAPNANAEEQAELVKGTPWIWHYISNAPSQDQVFNFATLLSTGRTAYTTINGVGNASSSSFLEQQMPQLLKVFGENVTADAFDKAMDIDVLLDSQVYQDYLAGKYSKSTEKLDANDAWKNMRDRITITKVDSGVNTDGATTLDKTYYSAKVTLDDLASQALVKKHSDGSLDKDVDSQANVASTSDSQQSNSGSALFSTIQRDINDKMANASIDDKAQVLGSIPDVLNRVSNATSSAEVTGGNFSFVKPTTDGNSYLINIDTSAVTGSSNKYLANMPQIFKSFGDSLRAGDFDKAISTQLMENSQIYQDYKDGKYVPDVLKTTTTQKNDKSDLLGAIILAIIGIPVLGILMPIAAVVLAPLWIPIALLTFTVVFALTALPILALTLAIVAAPIILPIAAIIAIGAGLLSLIPILNLITIPVALIAVVVTVISAVNILLWLPLVIITGLVVLTAIIVPIVMFAVLIGIQVIAGIIGFALAFLPLLIPILAGIGLIIAMIFSGLGLLAFILSPLLAFVLPLVLWVIAAAVLTVLAAALPWIIGGFLGTLVGIVLIILAWYPIFNLIALIGGVLLFLALVVLMPQFLILGFLFWFIAFGFMALILTPLAVPVLYIAILVGAAMMLLFIPGLLIALSWPFWMSLVLLISVPIITVLVIAGLIPIVGWVMGPVAGIGILIQAGFLIASIAVPIMIGLAMMTTGIIGFDIAMAAAAVLELLKDKTVTKIEDVDIDTSWRLRIHPVGFWSKNDPLGLALI
ncbi:hypothetical protein [Companilactobacillus mishanensis]|uniref:Uncharacterized protein n=1 Tax=Companilactobacillus mishanensis TaxID=2486008 RepID=A0ABW9P824_9LACO|nr:hypothetical protein [Companilactobacillus mishanensis]MQS45097.1 hypothetical protein [Companilactobacillus mishanensis]